MSRIVKIKERMIANQQQAILILSPENIFYMCGFTGTSAMLLITLESAYLLTDYRYLQQAAQETSGYQIIRTDHTPFQRAKELTNDLSVIGIEEEYVTLKAYRELKEIFCNRSLADCSGFLQSMRQIKDEAEIEVIRQAVSITDQALESIIDFIRPGISEIEIALQLEIELRKRGASGRSFDYIVASGQRSSLPHGVASDKRLQKGEFIKMDFGAKYQRYCSDLTRTVFLGKPETKHRDIYQIVLEAQLNAIQAIKPGKMGKEIDAVARKIIEDYGYGEFFGHGLGHALGLEIHETPRFNTTNETLLEEGFVMTVEPGIYIPGWGGVRIEDVVRVTKNGVEVLTQASKKFIIID